MASNIIRGKLKEILPDVDWVRNVANPTTRKMGAHVALCVIEENGVSKTVRILAFHPFHYYGNISDEIYPQIGDEISIDWDYEFCTMNCYSKH